MPVKLGSITVPWAGEWMPSGHYQLTGIWNPNFRSNQKGRGLPECPVQTLQWAPTHSDASSWYNHRVWVLSVKGIYLGLSLRPYVDFVFSLPAILLHFLCQCPVEATTGVHKRFSSHLARPESTTYVVLLSVLGLRLHGGPILQHSWQGRLMRPFLLCPSTAQNMFKFLK